MGGVIRHSKETRQPFFFIFTSPPIAQTSWIESSVPHVVCNLIWYHITSLTHSPNAGIWQWRHMSDAKKFVSVEIFTLAGWESWRPRGSQATSITHTCSLCRSLQVVACITSVIHHGTDGRRCKVTVTVLRPLGIWATQHYNRKLRTMLA